MSEIIIRPYEAKDRDAVCRLAWETADQGRPLLPAAYDREIVVDILTRYYIERAPHSLLVAESGAEVVGYLSGCPDTRDYEHFMRPRVIPSVVMRGIGKGLLWQKATWKIFWAAVATWRRGGFRIKELLKTYPAHLHVNVCETFRGEKAGRRLVEEFLARLNVAGIKGVHAMVREDNPNGRAFFEQMGFEIKARLPLLWVEGGKTVERCRLMYGKRLK